MENVLLLPFAVRALHADTSQYGLQEGLTSVGFVIGSLVMARVADRLREGQWLVLSYLGMGLLAFLYSLQSAVGVAIGLIAVSGFLNAPSFVAGRLINQRNTPREMRGRVFSTSYVVRDVVYLVGMGLAGLADVIDVRLLFGASALVVIGAGLLASVLPGLGLPAAEWRRAVSLLRGAAAAPGMAAARAATLADVELLGSYVPALSGLTPRDRERLASHARVREAQLAGRTSGEGEYRSLSSMERGDVFGEIGALTGSTRTADVVAEEPTTLLEVPAATLKGLMAIPEFGQLVLSKMTERLSRTASLADLPRFGGIDHRELRQLRAEAGGEEMLAEIL
ncbi:MAG: MFS transporter [Chloroflexi bacterium]|nr:MAG: MFS transporter [Chloroflexota bacterium]